MRSHYYSNELLDPFRLELQYDANHQRLFRVLFRYRPAEITSEPPHHLKRWLDAYFRGQSLPIEMGWFEWGAIQDFSYQVLKALRQIPYGSTQSYQEIAIRVGKPTASRAVGQANHHNPFPIFFPCHRVIAKNGALGGFASGVELKKRLLDHEALVTADLSHMAVAINIAKQGTKKGEIPIGAVVVYQGRVIATAHNERETTGNPTHHAEILALERASKEMSTWRLKNCTVYVTCEPCLMCLGALLQARVSTLVYGCVDPKRLSTQEPPSLLPSLHGLESFHGNCHRIQIRGPMLESECGFLLSDFFRAKRS